MAAFDTSVWRERARCRHDKRVVNGKNVFTSQKQLNTDLVAISGLEEVVAWCELKGIAVSFSSKETNGLYEQKDKQVVINSKLRPQRALHISLHECGHIIIGNPNETQRYGMGYSHATAKKTNPVSNRIDILDEELSAWHSGKKLAKKLGIKLDQREYLHDRDTNVLTYVKWCCKAHPYENGADDD
jgi:hypothetical protein